MAELAYVELPVIQWLSGHGSTTPKDLGLGWTYRDEAAMAAFGRPLEDPLVESVLDFGDSALNSFKKYGDKKYRDSVFNSFRRLDCPGNSEDKYTAHETRTLTGERCGGGCGTITAPSDMRRPATVAAVRASGRCSFVTLVCTPVQRMFASVPG